MKKWISLLFAIALMLSFHAGLTSAAAKKAEAAAAPVPKLYLDGKAISANVPPALVNASVMVPVRSVAENLGYEVGWDTKKKQVSVKEGSTTILMTLGEPKATVNGKPVTMVEPPLLQSDTTLIPLRFVGETMGLQIFWDNGSKSVFLFSNAESGNNGGDSSDGTTDPDPVTDGGGDPGTSDGTTDPDPGTGGQPGDGDLIGVVDGPDGSDSTDGSTDGAVVPGSGDGAEQPQVTESAKLHRISYEPQAVVITYEGAVQPTVTVLGGPDRIVIDLANGTFSPDFAAGYASGIVDDFTPVLTGIPASGQITELSAADHDFLTKVRYSQYQNSPHVSRIVLDLVRPSGYEIVNDAALGQLRIMLGTAQQQPVKDGYTVVLDAGHGGSDPGARSVTGKWEKDFNLAVVKKVQAILAKEPKINLVLTRQSDTYPSLDDRINQANTLNADMFVSVHGNSWKPGIHGTETYYNRSDSQELAKVFHKNIVNAAGFKDNGVRTAGFKVIKYTQMPAVLLEIGYLSDPDNEKQMFTEAFQDRIAGAIAASIKQYFHLS